MNVETNATKRMTAVLAAMALAGLLAACTSPEERASEAQEKSYKAQESVANQRLELVKKYEECAKTAGGDSRKLEACDSYLKAAEALK
jgi:outer membrane biogenesis lipoprotein LolB